MQIGFGGTKQSPAARRKLAQRIKVDPVKKAHELIGFHGQEAALKIASYQVDSMKRVVSDGEPIEGFTGKHIRRNMGFWLSVRGYLSRKPKDLKKNVAA